MNKKEFIKALTDLNGSVKKALDQTGITMKQLIAWKLEPDFLADFDATKELAMAVAIDTLQEQARGGNAQSAIKVADLLRKDKSNDDTEGIEDRVMELLFQYADSNNQAQERFKIVFNCTQYQATKVFNRTAQTGKLQPTQRKKQAKDVDYNLLASKFERGELNEVDLMQSLLENALRESETSNKAEVRTRSTQLVIQLHDKLESIHERKRKAEEADSGKLIDQFDALAMGISPEEVAELRAELRRETEALEKKSLQLLSQKGV